MQKSPIEWTDFTANPLRYRDPDGNIVHACVHKSRGCEKCYAEALAPRYGRAGQPFTAENMKRLTPFLDEKELHHMLTYKPASGKRVFVADMTDLFGEWVPDDLLNRLFSNVLEMRENVQWQILTKRADRMREYLSWRWGEGRIPMRNIWVGVSVEDQKTADARIPHLLDTPGAIRFVSYEPALTAVDFTTFLSTPLPRMLDLIIIGGESGPGARPFNLQWARDTIEQCKAAGVAAFFKQAGSKPFLKCAQSIYRKNGTLEFDIEIDATMQYRDRKGADPLEWPDDLRVRQFPTNRLLEIA